jgi:hypothetical protein
VTATAAGVKTGRRSIRAAARPHRPPSS